MIRPNILIVEDDQNLGLSLKDLLDKEGYLVNLAKNISEAREKNDDKVQCIVLDWMLPDGQGVDLLKEIREGGNNVPVIMLTARTDLIDKVVGLESGANDYLTKPFEVRELLARIRVQLRVISNEKKSTLEKKIISVSGIDIDEDARKVFFKEKEVELTKMEYELLCLLTSAPDRAFSRDEILNKVWGYENFPSTRTVDTHVLQLRQKFYDELIETVRGVGYRLKREKSN